MGRSVQKSPEQRTRVCTGPCCCYASLIFLIIVGVIMAIFGMVVVARYRTIFMSKMSEAMPISQFSPTYSSFVESRATIYFKVWIFNVTNPDDVVTNGAKPVLREIGPYVYRNRRKKENIHFTDDGTRVFFERRKFYEFDEAMSEGRSENDTFCQLDLVAYAVSKGAFDKGLHRKLAFTIKRMKRRNPFTTFKVVEFLWGAPDKLLKKILPFRYPDPATRPPAVFGLLVDRKTGKSRNGLIDGNYTIYTGKGDISKYSKIINFKGMTRFDDVWPVNISHPVTGELYDPNVIAGNLGSFGPGITKDHILEGFGSAICSTMSLTYDSPTKIGPIDTLRFWLSEDTWKRYTGAVNRAMCSKEVLDNPAKCLQAGILNMTTCTGRPVMMSMPHFLYAHPFYQNLTEGLSPDPEKHKIYLDVDPLIGAPLGAQRGMQFNMPLVRFPFNKYRKIPEFTVLPIFWSQESVKLSPQLISALKGKVHDGYAKLQNIGTALLTVGIILLPIATILIIIVKQRRQKQLKNRQGDGSQEEKHPL